ncbi:MAG: metallophosphoesterase [Oscillospiraceae bacterium]
MRILVISDSHGDALALKRIIKSQPTAEVVFFCGDGEREAENAKMEFPEKAFYLVRGNCDWGSSLPVKQEVNVEGVKVFVTHGDIYSVKSTDTLMLYTAAGSGANIVLYGHTHEPRVDYVDEIHVVNPGSCHGSMGTFAVIDITKAGIVPVIMKNEQIMF